jgi:hypothetical protein
MAQPPPDSSVFIAGDTYRSQSAFRKTFATVRNVINDLAGVFYHIVVVTLSAGVAISLPTIARTFLTYWSKVEHEKLYLIAVEITTSLVLILCVNYIHRSGRERALAKMAAGAGLKFFFPWRDLRAQKRIKNLKDKQGTGRTIMVIGSTGYGTFVNPQGDLHTVLEKCLGAQIMLVNPFGREATSRIYATLHQEFTLERFREEVQESIALLRRLRASGKTIKLKLYSDPPLVKLAILGDYLWLKHYHTDLDVQTMPEYVCQHNLKDHGLYNLFSQYFMQRWEDTGIPEYDFTTDELVYRGHNGCEIMRKRFGMEEACEDFRRERVGVDRPGVAAPARERAPEA